MATVPVEITDEMIARAKQDTYYILRRCCRIWGRLFLKYYEEAQQNALLGLAKAALTFDDKREASFYTYSYFRVRGEIYDGLRHDSLVQYTGKMLKKPVIENTIDDDEYSEYLQCVDQKDAVQHLIDKESRQHVREAIRKLSRRRAKIVYMSFFWDMPNSAIAQTLNLNENLVSTELIFALRQLRTFLRGVV